METIEKKEEELEEPKAEQGKGDDPLAREIEEMMSNLESDEPLVEDRPEVESSEPEKEPEKEDETPHPAAEEGPTEEEPSAEEKPQLEGWEAEKQELLDRIEKLTQMVEQLSEVKLQQTQQPSLTPPTGAEKSKEEAQPQPQPEVATSVEKLDFLDGTSIDVLIDEPEKLNEALNKVYNSALVEAERRVFEKVLTSIPDIVIGHINRQTTIQGIVKDFYERNQDLKNVKRTVAAISNDVHAEHPDWEVGQVLEEAAKRTREMLGLRGSAQPKPREDTPAFAKGGSAKPPRKQPVNSLQAEIDELLNFE